jgi:ketosteroid isomerase-like protein
MNSDLQKIDELHRIDMQASQSGDYRTLRTLMSDDAVVLPPGGKMIRGWAALDASFAAMASHAPSAEVLEYRFDWHEIEILGDYAFEWGYISGQERNLSDGTISAELYHVMRILQRQSDNSWKVHRTIWNAAAPDKA